MEKKKLSKAGLIAIIVGSVIGLCGIAFFVIPFATTPHYALVKGNVDYTSTYDMSSEDHVYIYDLNIKHEAGTGSLTYSLNLSDLYTKNDNYQDFMIYFSIKFDVDYGDTEYYSTGSFDFRVGDKEYTNYLIDSSSTSAGPIVLNNASSIDFAFVNEPSVSSLNGLITGESMSKTVDYTIEYIKIALFGLKK